MERVFYVKLGVQYMPCTGSFGHAPLTVSVSCYLRVLRVFKIHQRSHGCNASNRLLDGYLDGVHILSLNI